MSIFRWSTDTLDAAVEAARGKGTPEAAAEAVSLAIGQHVTADSIDRAFRRHGREMLWRLIRKGRPMQPETEAATRDTERNIPIPAREEIEAYGQKAAELDEEEELVERLVAIVKHKSRTLEEICDKLGVPPKQARVAIKNARSKGFNVEIDGALVGRRPMEESDDLHHVEVECPGAERLFAVTSDIHFGSKYHLRTQLEDFVSMAYEEGVRQILVPGDILDGVYDHGRWELTHHGFDEQANEAAEGLPQHPGLSYHGIIGNHDETFEKKSGLAVVQSLQDVFRRKGRTDFHLYGARGAYLRLAAPGEERGLIVELWHPLKGPAYALSYKLQKKIEGYAVGQKPDVVIAGHWHQAVYFSTRGVHAMSAGTWQGGGSSFGKALGGAPSIGGWIVRYALTPSGTVRRFSPEWNAYYEREEPRTIALG